MPRDVLTFDIFISSPADVAAERDVVERVAHDLNRALRTDNVAINILRWEVDATPGYGRDSQEIINDQTPEFDIFVGILWSRFGTPTPRAGSGTEEEFLIAVDHWRKCVNGREILFYFGEAPMNPQTMDLDQQRRIREFREKLAPVALHGAFHSTADFERRLSRDLRAVVARLVEWHRRGHHNPTKRQLLRQRFEDLMDRPDTYEVPAGVFEELGRVSVLAGVKIVVSASGDDVCRGYRDGRNVDCMKGW